MGAKSRHSCQTVTPAMGTLAEPINIFAPFGIGACWFFSVKLVAIQKPSRQSTRKPSARFSTGTFARVKTSRISFASSAPLVRRRVCRRKIDRHAPPSRSCRRLAPKFPPSSSSHISYHPPPPCRHSVRAACRRILSSPRGGRWLRTLERHFMREMVKHPKAPPCVSYAGWKV